jgi:hypothetical protein
MRSAAAPFASLTQTASANSAVWFDPASVRQKPSSKSVKPWRAVSTAAANLRLKLFRGRWQHSFRIVSST